MDEAFVYEFRVEGLLGDRWSTWFEGLTIRREPNDHMVLCGELPDQAALHGILAKIRDLNLVLVSLNRQASGPPDRP